MKTNLMQMEQDQIAHIEEIESSKNYDTKSK